MEEYGLVIVIVIVVAMLIGVASYVSREGKGKMEDTFDGSTQIGEKALQDAKIPVDGDNLLKIRGTYSPPLL